MPSHRSSDEPRNLMAELEASLKDAREPSAPAKRVRQVYEVVCTYEIEADSKAACGRIARKIAESLSRTGVLSHASGDGYAEQKRVTARFKRHV